MGICPTCGGVNGFSVTRIVDLINKDAPHPWAIVCPGHAEPEPKHDGKLDEVGTLTVKLEELIGGCVVEIMEGPTHWLWFTPKQALSLLSWLEQEKPTLEKMVGVEKDEAKG